MKNRLHYHRSRIAFAILKGNLHKAGTPRGQRAYRLARFIAPTYRMVSFIDHQENK